MRMPFGKHRGEEVRDLPDDYVEWLAANTKLFGALRQAIRDELEDRGMSTEGLDDNPEPEWHYRNGDGRRWNQAPPAPPPRDDTFALSVDLADRDILHALVNTGYQQLAIRWHPDKGGSVTEMVRLNRVVAELRKQLE